MKKRKIILLVSLALLATLIMAVPGSARAVKEPFAEKNAYCTITDMGEERLIEGKIWQIRGREYEKRAVPLYGTLPDAEGWSTSVVNINLNLETGTGSAWGTWVRTYDLIDDAWMEGTFAGGFTGGIWYGRVTGKGYGAYDGFHVKGFQQDIPDPTMLPEGGDPCPGGALPGSPGGILTGYVINTHGD